MKDKKSIGEIIRERIGKSAFCYAKSGGQGFVDKKECECFIKGGCCQAVIDKNKFHSYFEGMSMEESAKNRNRIIKEIEEEFKDSQWFNDNVVK